MYVKDVAHSDTLTYTHYIVTIDSSEYIQVRNIQSSLQGRLFYRGLEMTDKELRHMVQQ